MFLFWGDMGHGRIHVTTHTIPQMIHFKSHATSRLSFSLLPFVCRAGVERCFGKRPTTLWDRGQCCYRLSCYPFPPCGATRGWLAVHDVNGVRFSKRCIDPLGILVVLSSPTKRASLPLNQKPNVSEQGGRPLRWTLSRLGLANGTKLVEW